MKLNKNIGRIDQVLRFGIGAVLIFLGFFSHAIPDTFTSLLIGGFGIINVIAALVRVCPLYYAVGISSCRAD